MVMQYIQHLSANGANDNGVLQFVELWEYKCDRTIFSAFRMFSKNDTYDPNTSPN